MALYRNLSLAFRMSLALGAIAAAQDHIPTGSSPPPLAVNDPCAFHDLDTLTQHVVSDWSTSNVSLLVGACPQACLIAYGSGDPDITGIGAMISYIIQGATTVLFGPVLFLICLLVGSDPAKDSFTDLPPNLWISDIFSPVARSLHRANIVIAVSVLVASVIHLHQACPVAIMRFLNTLAAFQCRTAFICAFSYLPIHEASRLQDAITKLYLAGCYAMSLVISAVATYPSSYAEAMQEVMTYCIAQNKWPNAGMDVVEPPIHKDMREYREKAPVILTSFPVLAIVVGGLWLMAPRQNPYVRFCRALHVGPRRFAAIMLAIITTAGSFLVSFVGLWELLWLRQSLRQVGGLADETGKWSFGQITAVMMWLPVAVDILLAIRDTLRHFIGVTPPSGTEEQPMLPAKAPTESVGLSNIATSGVQFRLQPGARVGDTAQSSTGSGP